MIEEEVRARRLDSTAKPRLPQLEGPGGQSWLRRWRCEYGATFRTVNLRYTCSREVLFIRLNMFWFNILAVSWLHHYLYVEPRVAQSSEVALAQHRLRFDNSDQTPLWFNTAALEKTFSLRGSKRVAVKELQTATRERFTVMTRVAYPTPPSDGRVLAILFKAASGEHLRPDLDPSAPAT